MKFLLDEHYPGWLAEDLRAVDVDVVSINRDRMELQAADDSEVLRVAAAEGRVVVTEDVTTFGIAATAVPEHVGIVYVHHRRFPRTRPDLNRLCKALINLAADPPAGLGEHPLVCWL